MIALRTIPQTMPPSAGRDVCAWAFCMIDPTLVCREPAVWLLIIRRLKPVSSWGLGARLKASFDTKHTFVGFTFVLVVRSRNHASGAALRACTFPLSTIPIHRTLQPLLEIHGGLVAEGFLGAADVGERVLDVAFALRAVLNLTGVSGQLFQSLESFVQVDARSCGYVEHPSRNLIRRGMGRQQVRAHGVVDVGEVAALAPVAEDRGLLAAEHLRDEFCQHA